MTIHRIRLSKMQKIVNVLALASFAVSGAVVGSGVYIYLNRASILDGIKSQALEAVTGSLGSLGGLGGGSTLPLGSNDLVPPASPDAPQASTGLNIPNF
tara:strand:+ start:598 stop:894 length:297 start_codon:yes stop_codon:yes gene_type:complete